MSRRRTLGPKKRLALTTAAAVVAGGGAFALAATSNASQVDQGARGGAQSSVACDGLTTALANNQKFIDGQKANPDAQSEARIANREAVIAEIKRKQEASGCDTGAEASAPDSAPASASASAPASASASAPDASASAPATSDQAAASGEQVCAGQQVTLSGEGGAPAASSDQFPAGTQLKVTNLDNDKSTTVEVTATSGSCALLNNAAFEQVREPGKFLIRNARIEKVG
ncbi:hypothetical protein ACIRLA_26365 [Streptomyces sp. NPDC102364]|uniref:hypothetical protein n=1 Tax=Streptomyces sp. NPDC102364 TaxID=3366161 RepID=UPI0037FF3D9C